MPQTGKFETKRRNSASKSKDSDSPSCNVEDKYMECSLHPQPSDSESVKKCNDTSLSSTGATMLTPTRMERQNRSRKRSQTTVFGESKKMRQSTKSDDRVSMNTINNGMEVTSSNSSSDEADLPAISMCQTPTKGYSSCEFYFVFIKQITICIFHLCSERCKKQRPCLG